MNFTIKSFWSNDALVFLLVIVLLIQTLYPLSRTQSSVSSGNSAEESQSQFLLSKVRALKTKIDELLSQFNHTSKEEEPHEKQIGEAFFDESLAEMDLVPENFIYVYDLGELTQSVTEVIRESERWEGNRQYEGEFDVYDLIVKHNYSRTHDPEKAVLFYVPFFSARFTLSLDIKSIGFKEAINETSQMWALLLTRIRREFPYFNRSNGRDHFSVLTMDHGRCSALNFCDPGTYGEMFFLQLNGDKMVRGNHAIAKLNMQAFSYNYGINPVMDLPAIPCYIAGRDIVIPPKITDVKLVKPQEKIRMVTVLLRFGCCQEQTLPILRFNHLIRKELVDMYRNRSIQGWDIQIKQESNSVEVWSNATFCLAPPGYSQWTSRLMRVILGGCIPVTFFRDHDNPWQDEMNWDRFSINIDADELYSLPDRINDVLSTPGKLANMQNALEYIQESVLWAPNLENGAMIRTMKALRKRAKLILMTKL